MSNIDFSYVSEYVKDNYPDIVDKKLAIAKDVCNNSFLFDMPHDLERTTEMVHFDGDIDWEHVLNGDKEFAYQLARHRYFIDLAEAYKLTGNEEYVIKIVSIMTDFIHRCPYKKSSLAWRTLETGLRGEYWTRAMAIIGDNEYLTDEFKALYRESLDIHAKVLIEEKIPHHRLSNWGVLQDHGLYAIGVELDNQEYQDIALDRLYEEANLQVMADGMHWEVSTTYHNEVLGCFVDTILRAIAKGVTLDSTFLSKVKAMADVDLYTIKPDHNGPLYGDSDVTDLRGMLSTLAYIFDDGDMRYVAGDVFDYDNAWRVGKEGIDKYLSIVPTVPKFTSKSLSDSGNYVMRTSYDENANYLIFHNGNTGGGHAHEDKLSFELSIRGKDVLVDTGRYSYVWNNERKELKSYRAHNTSSVDNSHFIKAFGWDYIGTIAPSIREEMTISDKYEMVRGTHVGYVGKFKGSITTRRSILWLKDDIYIVIDEFFGKGSHKYAQYFNFAPLSKIEMNDRSLISTNDGVKTKLYFLTKDVKVTKEKGLYSHHYNAIEDIERVVAETKGKANAHMLTAIVGNVDKHKDIKVERIDVKDAYGNVQKDADAIKIVDNGVTYTLIMTFKEHIKLLLADDKPATGKFTLYINDEYNILSY